MAEEFVVGVNGVEEALRAGRGVNRVYIAKESHARGVKHVVDLAKQHNVRFDYVPQAKLNELTGTLDHQGIAAAVSPVEYVSLEACLAGCGRRAVLLALDRIQHPKNLGQMIRTAAGAGAAGVVVTSRGGALLDRSVVRASAGTVFRVPIVNSANLCQTLRALKKEDFWVYGLDAHGSESAFHTAWGDRSVVVVGNESEGLRPGVRKICDALVHIPMATEMDSLNASVAAGIALFQYRARSQPDDGSHRGAE